MSSNSVSYENFDGEVTPDLLAMPEVERKKLPLDVQLKIWKHLKKGAPLNETAIKKSHKQNLNHQPQALGDKTNMARTVSAGPAADPFKDSVKKSVLPPSNPPFEQHPKISGKKERKAHHQSTATASSFSVFQDDVKGPVAADPVRPVIAFDKVLGVVDRIDDLADWMNSLTCFFESLNTSIQALPELKNIKDSLEMSTQSIKNSNEYLKSDWHEIIQEASGLQSALAETMQENEALNDKISVLEEELLMAKNIDDDDKMDVTDDQVAGSNNNNGEADLNESEFDGRYLCQNQDNSMVYNDAPFCPQSIQDASCQTDYHMDSVLTMAKSFAFQSRLLNDQNSEQTRKFHATEMELKSQIQSLSIRVDELLEEKMILKQEQADFEDALEDLRKHSLEGLSSAIDQKKKMQDLYEREKERREQIEELYSEMQREFLSTN